MNITNISKAKILAALFNAAKPLGYGYLHYNPDHIMTEQEAEELLETQTYFDYHEGRLMKIDLSKDQLYTALYNRDNLVSAEIVIDKYLSNQKPES